VAIAPGRPLQGWRYNRETRQLPVFDLVVVPGGPKLPAAKPADWRFPFRLARSRTRCRERWTAAMSRVPWADTEPGCTSRDDGSHVSDLIRDAYVDPGRAGDRPKTGFAGEFDLDLGFTGSEPLRAFPNGTTDPKPFPIFFAALEQQLGLKLAPAKGPVDVLVVDHAEAAGGAGLLACPQN